MAIYTVNVLRWEPQSADLEVEAANACEAMGKARRMLSETNGACCDSWEIVQREAKHSIVCATQRK